MSSNCLLTKELGQQSASWLGNLLEGTSMQRRLVSLLLVLSIACSGSEALAHAELVSATPQVGSVITLSPSEVRLRFSESVEPRFSGVEITAVAGGQRAPA